jgi:hypothetical protein
MGGSYTDKSHQKGNATVVQGNQKTDKEAKQVAIMRGQPQMF